MLLEYHFKKYNFRLLLDMLALSVIGLMAIWSATGQSRSTLNKQIMGIVLGLVIALVLSVIDYHWILSVFLRRSFCSDAAAGSPPGGWNCPSSVRYSPRNSLRSV